MARRKKKDRPLIALSAGGTGGHIWPALALHHTLIQNDCDTIIITDSRGFRWLPRDEELYVKVISASAIHAGILGKIKSGFKILSGTSRSFIELMHYRPSVIIGFGGYPSFPALLAAKLLKIPIILHEQNSIFGRANKVVAPWTDKIALSFPKTKNIPQSVHDRCVLTGNPPQEAVISLSETPYPSAKGDNSLKILVLGGSQGAEIFGEVVHKAIEKLPSGLKERIVITQQCLEKDIPTVEAAYETMGVTARVEPFISDYIEQVALSHLIISRAGAGSVSLYANIGRPAIYVPLAISLDGDQAQNAKNMTEIDGGWIIEEKELSPTKLASKLEQVLNAPEQLKLTAENAKKLSRLDATTKLAELIKPYL